MDRMYRLTRHVYDLSRRYYLLGRDRLIAELDLAPGESLCEIGCGTARNLIKTAQAYPAAGPFYGFDISEEMLKTARASVTREGLEGRIRLAQASAADWAPEALFPGTPAPRRLVFSYSLSIMPVWREALEAALKALPPGGTLHIVDFGDQAGLPGWFRAGLYAWLRLFHVEFRPELLDALKAHGAASEDRVEIRPILKGYAYLATVHRAG